MLENLQPIKRQYNCSVSDVLKTLEESDKKILERAIADAKTWTGYGLHAALKARGIKLYDKAIIKHRLGDCSC
jgi:hypothetical protein